MILSRWGWRVGVGRYSLILAAWSQLAMFPAAAQQPKVQIHGFGEWGYGRTDGNQYLIGDEHGDYTNAAFALNLNALASDRLTVVGQVEWTEHEGNAEIELDYAFVDWWFADAAHLRVGKIKHPFAIYSEVQSVGTLRPFFSLPQAIYGPHGIVADGFTGAGISGELAGNGSWGVMYDVYGGSIIVSLENLMDAATGMIPADGELRTLESAENMVGGRIVLRTPLAGLGVGLSGYKGEVGQIDETGEDIHLPQTTFGGYLDYAGDRALLRAEAFRHLLGSSDARTRMDGWYTEGAYRVFGPWQLAARYERMDMDMSMGMGMMPAMASLMRHEAVTFGLNYWFDMGFVLKASYHNVEGNRFAHPTDVSELRQAIMDGDLPPSTDAFLIGAQFSF